MEHPPLNTARFDSLDYLRGLMACSVLVFHFDKWLTGIWDAHSLQGRLGVYAVSIFFVLSGLTLSLVYRNRLDKSLHSWWLFFRKRFWRIFPLLWLATALTLVLNHGGRSWTAIFLNFTGLFGFINPADDIATGAWSIGCELVFYAAFPTLFLLGKRSKPTFLALLLLLSGIAARGAYAWFSPENGAQSSWWPAYVQVMNQAFFFAGGMGLAIFSSTLQKVPVWIWRTLLPVIALAFAFWPIGHEPFELVAGTNRIVFSVLALCFVTAFFYARIQFKGWLHRSLNWMGAISYSLYLLHPLVFRGVKSAFVRLGYPTDYWNLFLPALLGTLLCSAVVYYYVERRLMSL